MGDTIIISNPDSLQNIIGTFPPNIRDSIIEILQPKGNEGTPTGPSFFQVVLFCFFVATVIYFKTKSKKDILQYTPDPPATEEAPSSNPDCYYYDGNDLNLTDADIIPVLEKYYGYFNFLS